MVNVQNIPRDDKLVKSAFVPKLDAFFFADYPNIELKLLGFYLDSIGHPSMAQTFRDGADLHIRTAAGVFGVPEESVTDLQRQTGKRLNFSIVYGGGIRTLLRQGVAKDFNEAYEMLKGYHGAWPGIGWSRVEHHEDCPIRFGGECPRDRRACVWVNADRGSMADTITRRLGERGYITTLWGRHLHPHSGHVALNALVQGCAADLMKWACIQIHRWLQEKKLKSHLVNVVHDEVIMDAVFKELPILAENVPDLMTYKMIADVVPIRPEPDVSYTTWADKEPYVA